MCYRTCVSFQGFARGESPPLLPRRLRTGARLVAAARRAAGLQQLLRRRALCRAERVHGALGSTRVRGLSPRLGRRHGHVRERRRGHRQSRVCICTHSHVHIHTHTYAIPSRRRSWPRGQTLTPWVHACTRGHVSRLPQLGCCLARCSRYPGANRAMEVQGSANGGF